MKRILLPSAPNFVDLNITNNCNMFCKHCYIGAVNQYEELDYMKGLNYIDQMAELGVFRVSLTGGEPLLHPKWKEFLLRIVHDGMSPMMNTNGTLFDKDTVDFISNITNRNMWIAVSLDGMVPGRYSKLRKWKNGLDADRAFEIVIKNVGYMIQSGLHVVFNFTNTNVNYKDLFPLYSFLEEKFGEDNFTLNVILFGLSGNGYQNSSELSMSNKNWKLLINTIAKEKLAGHYSSLKLEPTCPWEIYLPLKDYSFEDIEQATGYISPLRNPIFKSNRSIGCHAGISNLVVNWDGSVFPCGLYPQLKSFCAGNLNSDSLKEIWSNSNILNELRSTKISDLPETCQKCKYSEICGGGCRGAAMQINKSISKGDTRCPMYEKV